MKASQSWSSPTQRGFSRKVRKYVERLSRAKTCMLSSRRILLGTLFKQRRVWQIEDCMEHFSIYHWLIVIVCIAMMYPYVRIVQRTGYSGWWILTMFIPVVNFVMFWVFAFVRWPAVDGGQQRS
jgi:hypothetical protein